MSYLTRRIAVQIVLLAVSAFFTHQSAFAFTSGDFEYDLDYSNMTAAVAKYKGSASSVSIPSLIDVPEQYKDEDGEWHTRYKVFTVIGIGESAFQGNATITSVELPSSVWYTSTCSFADCTSLTSFPFDRITSYGRYSFRNCTSLKSVITSGLTTYYGVGVFHGCTALVSAEINGSGDATINNGSASYDGFFAGCSALEIVKLGNGVKRISCSNSYGSDDIAVMFRGCDSLREVDFGGITQLYQGSLQGRTSLKKCLFPNATSIGNSMFSGCSNLEEITPLDKITSIGEYAFQGCSSLSGAIDLPNIESIGRYAFKNCTEITSVTTSSKVGYYPYGIFQGCTALVSAEINGNGDATIKNGSASYEGFFAGCSALEIVKFGNGVKRITCSSSYGSDDISVMFSGCDSLREVDFGGITQLYQGSLMNRKSLKKCLFPNATSIGNSMFGGCSSLEEITPLDKITSIGEYAFHGCSSLPGVIELSSLESIGRYAFCNCTSITSVTTSDKVGYYPYCVFKGCSGIVSAEINGNGNCTIRGGVGSEGGFFENCTSLKVCRLGAGVTQITSSGSYGGDNVTAMFRGCDSLLEVHFDGLTELYHGSLQNRKSLKKCLFPNATSIGNSMFSGCSSLEEITSLYKIASIGEYVFNGCAKLTAMSFSPNLTYIGNRAFYGCSELGQCFFAGVPPNTHNDAFLSIKSGAVGYYTAEHKTEWEDVIPSSGLWKRLIMKPAKQPVLLIESVDWSAGSIKLKWDTNESGEAVDCPCTIYRSTTANFADAEPIAEHLTETSFVDNDFVAASPVTSPLYYWVVPDNKEPQYAPSLPIPTRHRYGLFVTVDNFENNWEYSAPEFARDTERIKNFFSNMGFDCEETLRHPSTLDVTRSITALATKCSKGDMALIWIHTHGGSGNPRNSEIRYSWLSMAPQHNRYFSEQMALDLATFDKNVAVTPIIYACHAGGMLETSDATSQALDAQAYINSASPVNRPNFGFIASAPSDVSFPFAKGSEKPTAFPRFILDGYDKNASDDIDSDGILSMFELFSYVNKQQQTFYGFEIQWPNINILKNVLLAENYIQHAQDDYPNAQPPQNLAWNQNGDGSVDVTWDEANGAEWYIAKASAIHIATGKRITLRYDLLYESSARFNASQLRILGTTPEYADYQFSVLSGNEYDRSEEASIPYTPPEQVKIVNFIATSNRVDGVLLSWEVVGRHNIDSYSIKRGDAFLTCIKEGLQPTVAQFLDTDVLADGEYLLYGLKHNYRLEAYSGGQIVAYKETTGQRQLNPKLKVSTVGPISSKAQIYHLEVDSNTKIRYSFDEVDYCTLLFTNGTPPSASESFYFAFKENLDEHERVFTFTVWACKDSADGVPIPIPSSRIDRRIVQCGASIVDSENDQNSIPSDRTIMLFSESEAVSIDHDQTLEIISNLDANGENIPEIILSGDGTVEFSDKSSTPAVGINYAEDWTGTLVMDWEITEEETKGFDFNKWGIAGATIDIAMPFTGYAFKNATINPTLYLSSSLTINDGWRDSTTTFYGITGPGDFTASGRGDVGDRYFHINTLSKYTGTLSSGSWGNGVFEIDDIQTDVPSGFGQRIVKGGETLKVRNISATTLNGSEANLCVDSVNGELGIYVAAAETVTDDGTRTGYATIDNALSAADGAGICTVVVYDTDSATNDKTGWILENGVYESTRQIASVGDNFYPSLNRAIRAAMASGTNEVVLLVDTADAINEADWTGTVVIPWDKANTGFPFDKYGNDNSTIEISGAITGWPGEAKSVLQEVISRVKVTGSLGIIDGSSRARCVFDEITGNGVLVFNTDKLYAIDRLSDWDGALTIVNQNTMLMNVVSGAGTIESFAKPQYVPNFGSGWHGAYVVGFDWADEDGCLLPGKYGVTGSTVVIAQPITNGYFISYSGEDSLFIEPNLYLKADVTITDGFSDAHNVTTFPQIGSDSGVKFSTRAGNSRGTYYLFEKLRDFNGTLVVSDYSKVTIGEIATDRIPLIGERILNVQRSEVGAEIIDLPKTKLSVNGVLKEVELELMDDGIYVAGYGEHYPLFDIGEKGIITSGGGTYNVVAADGEVLEDGDFSFAVAREAYSINISGDGKSATIALNPPMVNMVAPEDETDTNDPSGMLVVVDESKISSKPVPNEGEEVGALPVNAYKGLFYQVGWGSDLNNLIYGDKVQAVGGSLYLGVIKQSGERGFYKVTVSEK